MSTVGFVGLGAMGSRIAGRLLDAGNELYGTNRTKAKAEPLIERGLHWRDSPREVAAAADVVFSMVTDDAGARGDRLGARRDPRRARRGEGLRRHEHRQPAGEPSSSPSGSTALGAQMLDAPVSGSIPQAESGTLAIFVGGSADGVRDGRAAAARARPSRHPRRRQRPGAADQARGQHQPRRSDARLQRGPAARRTRRDRPARSRPRSMSTSSIGSPMLKARVPLLLDLPEQAWFDVALMHEGHPPRARGSRRARGRRSRRPPSRRRCSAEQASSATRIATSPPCTRCSASAERSAGGEPVAMGDFGEVVEGGGAGERRVFLNPGDVAGEQAVHRRDGGLAASGRADGLDLAQLRLDLGDEAAGDDVRGFDGAGVAGELERGGRERAVGGVADGVCLGDVFGLGGRAGSQRCSRCWWCLCCCRRSRRQRG